MSDETSVAPGSWLLARARRELLKSRERTEERLRAKRLEKERAAELALDLQRRRLEAELYVALDVAPGMAVLEERPADRAGDPPVTVASYAGLEFCRDGHGRLLCRVPADERWTLVTGPLDLGHLLEQAEANRIAASVEADEEVPG